jgi:hypothetical protein
MLGDARRWSAAALGLAPLALLATGGWMRTVRGPSWLAFNFDPPYAYLLNSLAILKGYPPYLIQHPGMPLQAIGSLVMALRHATAGHGTLAQDVIAEPEVYVTWIYWTALIVSAALVAAAGVIVWRRAGLGAALLVQSGPWLSVIAVSLAGQMRAEALIVGTVAVWTACLVAHLEHPTRSTAIRLGVMTGLTLSLHLSALPLVAGPLLLLDGWRDRARFLVAMACAFLVAFLPAFLRLASFAKYLAMLTLHSGHYGSGPATIVDVRAYVPTVRALLAAAPLATALVVVSAAVWAAWNVDGQAGGPDRLARRGLGALVATDVVCVLLTAKHPDAHYLMPMLCTLGANVWLIGRYVGRRAPAWLRPAAAAALVAIAGVQTVALRAEASGLDALRGEQEASSRRAVEAVDREHCFLLSAYRASSEEQALQWGNITAEYKGQPLFGREIAERFPRAAFDAGALEVLDADWKPVDLEALLRRETCVVYLRETANAPRSSSRIRLEVLSASGPETLYRVRLTQ